MGKILATNMDMTIERAEFVNDMSIPLKLISYKLEISNW